MCRTGRHRRIGASVAATLMLACSQLFAQEAQAAVVKFNIDSQPLAQALNTWADQARMQIIWPVGDPVAYQNSPPVRGRLAPMEALRVLLGDTGLTFSVISRGQTVAIHGRERPAVLATTVTNATAAETGAAGQAEAVTSGRRPDGATTASPTRAAPQSSTASAREHADTEELEEIVVTGTHIRGLKNNTVPIVVLDKAYIDSTGSSTASRLIESLPQNFALTSQAGVAVPGVTGVRDQGSSINLRGIGEGTTLVLLNGRRMAPGFIGSAVDISAIPLSALDRVEVLTDGASALYGSDAVGGVVNFILRRDFEGAETRLRVGEADGINEYRVSQALGTTWQSGNALLALEYYKRDLLRATDRDFVPSESEIGSLYPEDENYSAMFTGRQEVTDSVNVFADALYTHRESYNEAGRIALNQNNSLKNPQIAATLGLEWSVGRDWQVELLGSYARNKMENVNFDSELVALGFGVLLGNSVFEIEAAQVKADGSVFELPGGSVRVAVGADWRSEVFRDRTDYSSGLPGLSPGKGEFDQIVRSAFGQVHVPIFGTANARPGIQQLELSLAGRYDDYSSFGSSFDPQVGLMWEPARGLRLRGAYGTSYKAPKLTDYNLGFNSALALFFPDPGVPAGVSHQLLVFGNDASDYSAQESESASFGVELKPSSVSGLQLALNYYRIRYNNRITEPPSPDVALANPSSFGSLLVRDPTVAQVNDYIGIGQLGTGFAALNPDFSPNPDFTPDSVDVIVDLRRRNLSSLTTNGLDAAIQYAFRVGEADLNVGLAGTYIFEFEQKLTSTSTALDTVDTFSNPPQMRLRGSFAWRHQAWATNFFVNHTNSYTDIRTMTPVAIDSYTTLDGRLAYDFGERFTSGPWSGVTVALSIQNLLDEDPPRTAVVSTLSDLGFDPTNSNPLGRLIALEFMKSWGR